MCKSDFPSGEINALLISALPENRTRLGEIFRSRKWRLKVVTTCREAVAATARKDFRVVICEENLPDGDWRLVLEKLSGGSGQPFLIITSRIADERLWAEALNLGAYDVLAQPFDPAEVSRVVAMAWHHSHPPGTAKASAAP